MTATGTKTVVVVDDDTSAPIIHIGPPTSLCRQVEAQEQVFSWEIVGEYQSKLDSALVVITRDTGTGPEQIFFSGDAGYPVSQSFNFDSYGPGTYEISVTATDGDNDRPNDRLTSHASQVVVVLPGRGIVWANREDSSDHFDEVFGESASLARNVVDEAIAAWNRVIDNFNYFDGTDGFPVTFSVILPGPALGLADTSSSNLDALGVPRCGAISLWRGTDGHGLGWWLDPTPADSWEFSRPLNPFCAAAQTSNPAYYGCDMYTTVLHEIGHAIGISDTYFQAHQIMGGYLI